MTITLPSMPVLQGAAPPDVVAAMGLVDEFNAEGHHEGAKAILDFILHEHHEWDNDYPEYIASKLIESNNYRKALDIAVKHFDTGVYGPVEGSASPLFAAFYPQVYAKMVKVGYQNASLPQGAIEGIIREESLFQRTARSPVGATGLMQLMPGTANMLKKAMTAQAISDDLTDVQSNILLGATYLKQMQSRFDGQLPLAIMAYNAGPCNVNKWLRNNGEQELDEFIENIPFDETRGYVKRVMRSMHVYGDYYKEPYFQASSFLSFKIVYTPPKKNVRTTGNKRKRRK